MKNLFRFVALGLFLLAVHSCVKENIQPAKEALSNDEVVILKEKPKLGEIACIVKLSEESQCAGTRCGSPTGKCGKKETPCKCVSNSLPSQGYLNDGMTFEEFAQKWNDDSTRKELEKMGYYAEDVH